MRQCTYKDTIHACYLGYFVTATVNNFPPLLYVIFNEELGISLNLISFLITINFTLQFFVDFLGSKIINKIGYRKSIVIGNFSVAFGLVLMSVLPQYIGYIGLVIAISFCGIGGGTLEVLVSPIVQAAPDGKEKTTAMSLLHSFYCWGAMLVIMGTTLLFRLIGMGNWYFLPLIWTIIPFWNCFAFSFVPITQLEEVGKGIKLRKLFAMKSFWLLAGLMVCAGACELSVGQWASFYSERALGISKTYGDLLGPCLFAFFMGILRLAYGMGRIRILLKKVMTFSAIGFAFCLLIVVFAPVPILQLIACAFCGAMVGLFWPGTFSMSAEVCPCGGTVLFAMLAFFGDIGCAAGPAIVSFVATKTGVFEKGLSAILLFPVLILIILHYLKRLEESEKKIVGTIR